MNKKAVSIMIGYVLLVTSAIIMGVIVYQWIKTYVPSDILECPEGVSIFIKEYSYDCDASQLELTLKNNGMFNIAGYFIHATTSEDQELATEDLSGYTSLGEGKGGTVLFGIENSFEPNDETANTFDLGDSGIEQIYSIELIPVRFQEEDNKMRFVSCGLSKIKEVINCGEVGVPASCGNGTCDAGECASGCTTDCSVSDCCGIESCNEIIGETCENCAGDCGECAGGELILLEDGFEGGDWDANWDNNGITDWSHATDRKKSGSYSAENYGPGDDDLISDDLDTSDANEINIFFWYNKDDLDPGDFYVQIYDGNNYDNLQDLDDYDGSDNCAGTSGDDKWCRFNETTTDSQYFKTNFRLKFEGTETGWNERVWIDDVKIIKSS